MREGGGERLKIDNFYAGIPGDVALVVRDRRNLAGKVLGFDGNKICR